MTLRGTIEDIIYRNEENFYTVALIDSSGELITAVGVFPSANIGETVLIKGNVVVDKKYGNQFKASFVEIVQPNTVNGIQKYLSSGLIKGVGDKTAIAITEKFKENSLDIIENSPQYLEEIRGISSNKARIIHEHFIENKKMQNTIMFLQEHNIGTSKAIKIFKSYGPNTIKIMKENPYKLVEDIDGIGFFTADIMAQKLGVHKDSKFRIRAGLNHTLKAASDLNGNTYLPRDILLKETAELLGLDIKSKSNDIESILKDLITENIFIEINDEKTIIMLNKFFHMENSIANNIIKIKNSHNSNYVNISQNITDYEFKNNIKLHKNQINAIKTGFNSGVAVITGGPGTGKTTIIKCLIDSYESDRKNVLLLAPTGRAAKRLSESSGHEASTIHRALKVDFSDGINMFVHNELNKLDYDIIIIDEVSMMDVSLMYYLLKAIKATSKIILVGDRNQLPSVGAGNVLSDIISSKTINTIELTEVYRQKDDSHIILNAHRINNGDMPLFDKNSKDFFHINYENPEKTKNLIIDLVTKRLPEYLDINSKAIQILAPIKKGITGVRNLNINLQDALNPRSGLKKEIVTESGIFRVGDKVMQISNNYTKEYKQSTNGITISGTGVFNGDIGKITQINSDNNELEISFEDGRIVRYIRSELKEVVLSYAITIHKSQGSEYDAVIIPVIAGSPTMMTRNLLYTAVTRAKRLVVLVGSKKNIGMMVKNNYTRQRYSHLKVLLIKSQRKLDESML